MSFVDSLIREGWLKTPKIIDAFKKIKRADFLFEDQKALAEFNEALPIGYGQTISQPLVVAFMLELLQPGKGDKILDVGSGSGWTTALLSYIVSDESGKGGNGKVIALEIVPQLKEFGEKNVSKYNFINKGTAEFICADANRGYKKESPFDRILASASAQKQVPMSWKEQLKIGGRIVVPIGTSIWLLVKKGENNFEETEYPGFIFVPLISE